jgi:hypothetical protein
MVRGQKSVNFNVSDLRNPRHIKVDTFSRPVWDSMAVFGNPRTTFASSPPVPPLNLGFVATDFFPHVPQKQDSMGERGRGREKRFLHTGARLDRAKWKKLGCRRDALQLGERWRGRESGSGIRGNYAK